MANNGQKRNGNRAEPKHADYAYRWLRANRNLATVARETGATYCSLRRWKRAEDWEGWANAHAKQAIAAQFDLRAEYDRLLETLIVKVRGYVDAHPVEELDPAMQILRFIQADLGGASTKRTLRIEQEVLNNNGDGIQAAMRADPKLVELCQQFEQHLTECGLADDPGHNGGAADAAIN